MSAFVLFDCSFLFYGRRRFSCVGINLLLGRQGSVFGTHALSNKALLCGEAKISARTTQSLKTNTSRGIKSGIIVVVVVLMNNRCLESS